MSIKAVAWAIDVRVGDPSLKVLLIAIANYADAEGSCWPKVETLAFDSEVSKRTIQRSLTKLVELGLITVTARFGAKGKQTSSRFDLRMTGGDNLTPHDSVGGTVTPECRGDGDTTVSPLESLELSIEPSVEQSLTPALRLARDWPADYQIQWWKTYPRKHDKKNAMKSLDRIAKAMKTPWADLMEGTQHYAGVMAGKEEKFIKHPATFLNGESWKNRYNRNHDRPVSFLDAATQETWSANDDSGDHHDRP